jgi:hypothetical protein
MNQIPQENEQNAIFGRELVEELFYYIIKAKAFGRW